jgi:hypothetical protein
VSMATVRWPNCQANLDGKAVAVTRNQNHAVEATLRCYNFLKFLFLSF